MGQLVLSAIKSPTAIARPFLYGSHSLKTPRTPNVAKVLQIGLCGEKHAEIE